MKFSAYLVDEHSGSPADDERADDDGHYEDGTFLAMEQQHLQVEIECRSIDFYEKA